MIPTHVFLFFLFFLKWGIDVRTIYVKLDECFQFELLYFFYFYSLDFVWCDMIFLSKKIKNQVAYLYYKLKDSNFN